MTNHIELVEEKFQQYLPLLKEKYPQERDNKIILKKLAEVYDEMIFHDNVVVGLFDDRNASLFFLSKNFQKITYYNPSTIFNWGSLVLFKAIHWSHYSYPFNTYKLHKKFYKQLEKQYLKDACLHCSGLKLFDGKGIIRKTFLKVRPLIWNKNNQPDITIIFGEDVTHLMKGDNYWLRYTSGYNQLTYVHQKGKKEFNDLISISERRVLTLIAEKKTNAEIADELFLSKGTVETHRKNMIKRVGAVDSTALVHLCKMANVI